MTLHILLEVIPSVHIYIPSQNRGEMMKLEGLQAREKAAQEGINTSHERSVEIITKERREAAEKMAALLLTEEDKRAQTLLLKKTAKLKKKQSKQKR